MRRLAPALCGVLALAACGKLEGFGGQAPPLVSFDVTFSGDVAPLRPPGVASEVALSVALVWGAQWLTEPFCLLTADTLAQPPGFAGPAAVIAAGCRDPFGFVPASVGPSVPLSPDGPTSVTLEELPPTDVLVGGITARVAYGSLVVFDDRNLNGLDLAFPHRSASGGRRGDGPQAVDVPDLPDIIYGASFVTMTASDQRVAYREGAFVPSAFYPRAGCSAPPPGFSVLGASGFLSQQTALAAALEGQLPAEKDPGSCFESVAGGDHRRHHRAGARGRRGGQLRRDHRGQQHPLPRAARRRPRLLGPDHGVRAPADLRHGVAAVDPHPARRLGTSRRSLQGPHSLHAAGLPRGRELHGAGLGLHGGAPRVVAVPKVNRKRRCPQMIAPHRRTHLLALALALASTTARAQSAPPAAPPAPTASPAPAPP